MALTWLLLPPPPPLPPQVLQVQVKGPRYWNQSLGRLSAHASTSGAGVGELACGGPAHLPLASAAGPAPPAAPDRLCQLYHGEQLLFVKKKAGSLSYAGQVRACLGMWAAAAVC